MEVNHMTKKFRVTNEVGHFRVGMKIYKPGDIAEVPDDYPAHLYSFLQPVGKVPEASPKAEAQIGQPLAVPAGKSLKKRRWP
jgi:hypothetical protein